MPRAPAPQMPTKAQVEEAVRLARAVDPSARIGRIGPAGVEFVYPAASADPVEAWFANEGQGEGR